MLTFENDIPFTIEPKSALEKIASLCKKLDEANVQGVVRAYCVASGAWWVKIQLGNNPREDMTLKPTEAHIFLIGVLKGMKGNLGSDVGRPR